MKNYITTALTIFLGVVLLWNVGVLIVGLMVWDFSRVPDMYESDRFWMLVRSLGIVSLIIPIFQKFKIVLLK